LFVDKLYDEHYCAQCLRKQSKDDQYIAGSIRQADAEFLSEMEKYLNFDLNAKIDLTEKLNLKPGSKMQVRLFWMQGKTKIERIFRS
jgi:hypothetical protein